MLDGVAAAGKVMRIAKFPALTPIVNQGRGDV
jgi:hypothetical protein